ncbi:MAG: sialidase family protein [Thermoplasmatota archaeon]
MPLSRPRLSTVPIVLAALVLPTLSGCLSLAAQPTVKSITPGLPLPTLSCAPGACNFQATSSPPDRQANELAVAVNPVNPLDIIATGKDYTPSSAGQCTYAGIYVSKDGGVTWSDMSLPGSPWARMQDPSTPSTPFSQYYCATDPVVAFGPDGTAYWAVQPYQCDALSGSKIGRGISPRGGFNDWLYTCSAMYVLVSHDGGTTWPMSEAHLVASGPLLAEDKDWLAASPDGRHVLLCWDYSDPTNGAGQTGGVATSQAPPSGLVCSVSSDKGETWSAMTESGIPGSYPWVDYGPDGTAWMSSTEDNGSSGSILVSSSADGLKWAPARTVATYKMPSSTNEYGWPVLNGSAFRIVPTTSIGVDRSNGSRRGSVYVSYFDFENGLGHVYVVASRDGITWGPPVAPSGAAPNDKFLGAVSVGPDGIVDASWYDRRDDPQNHLFNLYYAYSADGGLTWSENTRVSNVSSDEQYSHHQNGMVFLGDYRGTASERGAAVLIWVDTRNHKADAFEATIERTAPIVAPAMGSQNATFIAKSNRTSNATKNGSALSLPAIVGSAGVIS